MGEDKRLLPDQLWETDPSPSDPPDILHVLTTSDTLPVRYWRHGFLFRGLFDETLHKLTLSKFPSKIVPFKRRPVFCLRVLTHQIGAEVSPCTTKKQSGKTRFIHKGCILYHAGHYIEKDSYIIEKIRFKIPSYTAGRLKFLGEVPRSCIRVKGTRNDGK